MIPVTLCTRKTYKDIGVGKSQKNIEEAEQRGIHKIISNCTKSKYFHDITVEKSNMLVDLQQVLVWL
jgi:hypothetical protein